MWSSRKKKIFAVCGRFFVGTTMTRGINRTQIKREHFRAVFVIRKETTLPLGAQAALQFGSPIKEELFYRLE
jgi:hypothetical protein